MKFQKLNFILLTLVAFGILSNCFVIKRNSEKSICFNSACGWEIHKNNDIVEYVENNCKCNLDELCVRTGNEYRLPGFKYHCKKSENLNQNELVTFPYNNNSSLLASSNN